MILIDKNHYEKVRKENIMMAEELEKLKVLNRKLTEELEIYFYKDTFKEA